MPTSNAGSTGPHATGGRAPALAVTMGDPQGIGLDITLMAWARRAALGLPPFLLYGEVDAARTRAHALGLDAPLAILEDPRDAADAFARALPVLPLAPDPAVEGASTVAAIERATADVAKGLVRALVTNPITKSKPGFERLPYPGHTEFLADLAHTFWGVPRPHPVMMLASDLLRVVPVTVHIPIAKVPAALSAELLGSTLAITHTSLVSDFGIVDPRIAVAGLNPHAGESGLIGREDADLIAPVLEVARGRGMTVLGPLSADTLFHAEARAGYDVALAMYHDQALIPIKTLSFDTGVNVTLGLPFVRTSPDHGTAFALAGTGKARPHSFVAAVRLADEIATRRAGAGVAR